MPREGLRAQAQRALQKVSHGKKSLGTPFPKQFKGLNPTVPLSQTLGLGQWDSADLGAPGTTGTPFPERYGRVLSALEARCPAFVEDDRWQRTPKEPARHRG
jgi:hypothetical protein